MTVRIRAIVRAPTYAALLFAGFLVLVPVSASRAELPTQTPETVSNGTAIRIVDGDTLVLQSGAQVRLTGIQAPKIALGRKNFRPWPLGEEAKAALGALTRGKQLKLVYGGMKIDRHLRLLAQLFDDDGTWIQGEMVRRGMARVYSFPDNRDHAPALLAIEREARRAKRGIWARSFYRVRSATETPQFIGSFQLVEGRIEKAALVRSTLYLNYGADYRTDFTVRITGRYLGRFIKALGASRASIAAGLEGKTIRVRGWIRSYNGPLIDLTHAEQLEWPDKD